MATVKDLGAITGGTFVHGVTGMDAADLDADDIDMLADLEYEEIGRRTDPYTGQTVVTVKVQIVASGPELYRVRLGG